MNSTFHRVVQALLEQSRRRQRLCRPRPSGPVVDRDVQLAAEYPECFTDQGGQDQADVIEEQEQDDADR